MIPAVFAAVRARRRDRRRALAMPELAELPPEQRVAAYRAADRRARRRPVFLLVVVVNVMIVAAALLLGRWFFGSRYNPGLPLGAVMVAFALCGAAVTLAVGLSFRRRYLTPQLWRVMPHTCGGCGYDLTANTSGTCPECGRPAGRVGDEAVE